MGRPAASAVTAASKSPSSTAKPASKQLAAAGSGIGRRRRHCHRADALVAAAAALSACVQEFQHGTAGTLQVVQVALACTSAAIAMVQKEEEALLEQEDRQHAAAAEEALLEQEDKHHAAAAHEALLEHEQALGDMAARHLPGSPATPVWRDGY